MNEKDKSEQRDALNNLFGASHIEFTDFKRPMFDLRQLVKHYQDRETLMAEDVLDPAHPEHWLNSEFKGWIDDPEAVATYSATLPDYQQMTQDLRPVQDDKPVILTKIFEDYVGAPAPKGPQGIGDCGGWGNASGLNIHQAVQIATGNANYEYKQAMVESIYALSRCEVGKQWGSKKDGLVGAWAAKALTEFGSLCYINGDKYDPKRSKNWGANGLPDDLEPEAKQHIYKTAVKVTRFDQAAQLIQAGIPVVVCSSVGFGGTRKGSIGSRDKDGFCKWRGKWYHCMVFVGVRFDREGLLCFQSWGPNVPDGPLVLDQPDNTFWVDSNVCDVMLGQGDSYGYADGFTGFSRNDNVLDYSF